MGRAIGLVQGFVLSQDGDAMCLLLRSALLQVLFSAAAARESGHCPLPKIGEPATCYLLRQLFLRSLMVTCSSSKVVTLSRTNPNLLLSMESGGGADAGLPGLAVQFLLLGLGDRAPPASRAAPRTATLARASRRPYDGVSPSCSRVGGEKDCNNRGSHLVSIWIISMFGKDR